MQQSTEWRVATRRTLVLAALLAAGLPLTASAQKGKGGADKDITVCVTFAEHSPDHAGDLTHDPAGDYCNSDRSTTAFVGRRRSITLDLNDTRAQKRRFVVHLGERLPDIAGDPDPNNDGGQFFQIIPGDWSDYPPLPEFPEGVVGEMVVASGDNVMHMGEDGGEPNPLIGNGRIRCFDELGRKWGLYWGSRDQARSGGFWVNTTTSKGIEITRQTDTQGNLIDRWDVVTLPDDHGSLDGTGREGKCAAFLWYTDPSGPGDYFGVFDVWFSWEVVAEQ